MLIIGIKDVACIKHFLRIEYSENGEKVCLNHLSKRHFENIWNAGSKSTEYSYKFWFKMEWRVSWIVDMLGRMHKPRYHACCRKFESIYQKLQYQLLDR